MSLGNLSATAVALGSANNATLIASLLLSTPEALSEGVDPKTCRLLGPFALVVQAVMGIVVIGSLILKRAREKPRRKWGVWGGDVSKQIVGQAFVHGSNVLISDLIARKKKDNPCGLYLANIAIDTTLGVFLLFLFLTFLNTRLSLLEPDSFRTGFYGRPFSYTIWAKQAAVYVAALGLMKAVVVALFWAIPGVFRFADWSLSWLSNDEAQVLFVMLIFPVFMNLLQFYIIDNILKLKSSESIEDEEDEVRDSFLPTAGASDARDSFEGEPGYDRIGENADLEQNKLASTQALEIKSPEEPDDGTYPPSLSSSYHSVHKTDLPLAQDVEAQTGPEGATVDDWGFEQEESTEGVKRI